MGLRPYTGYVCSNVAKDASYSVVSGGGGWHVRLQYHLNHRQKLLLTTDDHTELVEMVNAVKVQIPESGSRGGGRFYINEFKDVLVPDGKGGAYWAGKYDDLLEFDYDGTIISAEPPEGLQPGDIWPGPHAGIRYTLAAGGDDIKYEQHVQTGSYTLVNKEKLSEVIGTDAARSLAGRLAAVKGSSGGRIYLNECGHFFSNIAAQADVYECTYLGSLGDGPWFLAPDEFED